MSNLTKSRKGFIVEILLVIFVIVMATIFIGLSKLGKLAFVENVIRVTLGEEINAKLFSLLSNTVHGYNMENLLGYAILTDPSIEKPVDVNVTAEMENRLDQIAQEAGVNYYFFINHAGMQLMKIKSADNMPIGRVVLKYSIPLPYNANSLTAEVNLVEW